MTFDALKNLGDWHPIDGCPGRFVLRGVAPQLNLGDLFGKVGPAQEFRSPQAADVVYLVPLSDGGTISYRRTKGRWVHTLNTREGLRRKLEQLEITWTPEGNSEDSK